MATEKGKDTGSGLAQRGLLLLALMAAVAVAVWVMIWRGTRQELPTEIQRPEVAAALVAAPGPGLSGFPWGAMAQVVQTLPSARGWEVRYNATLTLARRGLPSLPLGTLAEMLDEDRQMKNFRARLQDGRDVPDEAAARRTVLNALRAFADWHKHKNNPAGAVGASSPGLQRVYAAIDKLRHSPNLVVQTEAKNTWLSVGKG
jgi:hypothetical protein